MLSPSVVPKLPKLMEEIQSAVETDMPLTEMVSLAQLLPSIREHGMISEMVPGSPAYLEDISYWLPDIMKLRQLVASQMNTELADSALESAQVLVKEYQASLPKGITVMAENPTRLKPSPLSLILRRGIRSLRLKPRQRWPRPLVQREFRCLLLMIAVLMGRQPAWQTSCGPRALM